MRWLFILLIMFSTSATAFAQDRGDLLEGFLKSLVESQLNRNDNRGRPPRPPGVVQPPAPTEQLLQTRQLLALLSSDSARLVQSLQIEERTTPQVRPLLADALSLNASADVLNQNGQRSFAVEELVSDFQVFDRDWRVLSHRLKQVPNLGRVCLRAMDSLAGTHKQISDLLGIQPQLNRNELVRLSASLISAYRHLLEDLQYDNSRVLDKNQLLTEGQALYLKVNQAMSLIERDNYGNIVNAYKDCQQDWQIYSAKLRQFNSARIQRGILEVEEVGRSIAEQLWLPVQMDRGYVVQLAKSVEDDAHHLLERVTLIQLVDHPNPIALVNSAKEFDSITHAFARAAENSQNLNDLAWDFRIYEVQWKEFSNHVRLLKSPDLDLRVTDLDRNLKLLQNALQLQPAFDRRSMRELAASLDELCTQMGSVADRTIGRSNNYQPVFRTQFTSTMDVLHHAAHELHDLMIGNGSDQQVANKSQELIKHWITTKQLLQQCRQQDQQLMLQSAAQIEPLMVKLQVVFRD